VLIMKQSWQRLSGKRDGPSSPTDDPFEFQVCKQAEFGDDRITTASGYVCSDHRIVDTLNFIRKNIPGEVTSFQNVLIGPIGGDSENSSVINKSDKEVLAVERVVSQPPARFNKADAAVQPTCRSQTRIFMKMRGWPIKYFKSLEELLRVMLDAVTGIYYLVLNERIFTTYVDHQRLYEKGILHRDASTGNIIINISSDSENSNVKRYGYLIDYDHAKTTSHFQKWPNLTFPPHSEAVKRLKRNLLAHNMEVTNEVAAMALGVKPAFSKAVSYLTTIIERHNLVFPENEDVSAQACEKVAFSCTLSIKHSLNWAKVEDYPPEIQLEPSSKPEISVEDLGWIKVWFTNFV
jgi:hypothetical protein